MMKNLRQVRHTLFIYCEGKTDYLFVHHLKKLYLIRGFKQITIKKGSGGDISTFISNTVKNAQVRGYDEKYIVLDTDKKSNAELEEAEQQSCQNNIQLIWQKPCLEGLFLRILKNNQITQETSESCKTLFYKEYNQNNKTLTKKLVNTLFPKIILDSRRQKIKELNQLIQLMEPSKSFSFFISSLRRFSRKVGVKSRSKKGEYRRKLPPLWKQKAKTFFH